MKLDRDTYEAWLLDRAEGQLTPEQEAQLTAYLLAHPDLDADREAWPTMEGGNGIFPDKHTLHRHFPPQGLPDAHRLSDFLIAQYEGDLDAGQLQALGHFIFRHPEAGQEQRLIAASRIRPEPLAFPGKEQLKKRAPRIVALWPRLAAAASLLLLLGGGAWWLRSKPHGPVEVARVERPVAPEQVRPEAVGLATPGTPPVAVEPERPRTAGPAHAKVPAAAHGPRQKPASRREEGNPMARPVPVPTQDPEQEPALAHGSPILAQPKEPVQPPGLAVDLPHPKETLASAAGTGQGQDIGVAAANAVRREVLARPARPGGLDGGDAIALADKAVVAITGGRGGLEVEHTKDRQRFRLRLGRNVGFSASIAR